MNHPALYPLLIRQRNEELLREVQEMRLEQRLRADRRLPSGQPRASNSIWRGALSLLRGAGL